MSHEGDGMCLAPDEWDLDSWFSDRSIKEHLRVAWCLSCMRGPYAPIIDRYPVYFMSVGRSTFIINGNGNFDRVSRG